MKLGAQHGLELGLPRLLQHAQGPQHVHLQAWVQAGQPRPQLLVHLARTGRGVEGELFSVAADPLGP